jgi:hypothetical protein
VIQGVGDDGIGDVGAVLAFQGIEVQLVDPPGDQWIVFEGDLGVIVGKRDGLGHDLLRVEFR